MTYAVARPVLTYAVLCLQSPVLAYAVAVYRCYTKSGTDLGHVQEYLWESAGELEEAEAIFRWRNQKRKPARLVLSVRRRCANPVDSASPVLAYGMLLRARYGVSGTERGYAGSKARGSFEPSRRRSSDRPRRLPGTTCYPPTPSPVCRTARFYRSPVCHTVDGCTVASRAYAMSGTDEAQCGIYGKTAHSWYKLY